LSINDVVLIFINSGITKKANLSIRFL